MPEAKMFEFLKNKLKQVVSKFSRKIEEEAKPVEPEAPKEELPLKAELKPEQKQELKPEPKPEPSPKIIRKDEKLIEETPLSKPLPKPEIKPEPKPELKPEPRQEPSLKIIKKDEKVIEQKPLPPKEEKKEEAYKPIEKPAFFDFLKKKPAEPLPKPAPKPELKPEPRQEPSPKTIKKEERVIEEKPLPRPEQKPEPRPESEKERKSIFDIVKEKITRQVINESQFEEMFGDLELALLENSVALEVIDKIKANLKTELVNRPLERGRIEKIIESSLKKSIEELFDTEKIDLVRRIREKKPFIICFVGINGSGKTTTIAKLAHLLKQKGISSVIAAGDTFRAAAIQQLEEHATRLNIKLIKHDYGADSAAVAYDAITHAKAHSIDVVLIDTAGRLHSNANLMDEVKKVKRVTKPDLIIFVGESITGNDCVEQAKTFDQELGIDAIILAKSDIDEKGGAAISISYVTKKPIMYLGTGQGYDDLVEFNPKLIIKSLGLET